MPQYMKMAAVDALRVILIIASLASYSPQLRSILSHGHCTGLAPLYILFKLISATEQFALSLYFILGILRGPNYIVHVPPNAGDWLNFVQFTVVWLGHLLLFILVLSCPPYRPRVKCAISAIYILYLLVSLVPVIVLATIPYTGEDKGPNGDREWPSALFSGVHMILFTPTINIISLAALFPQLRALRGHHHPATTAATNALSVEGLGLQAAVFVVVAVCWPFRFYLPSKVPWGSWYQLVGWAAVNNGVFALVQAVLYVFARREGGEGIVEGGGQTVADESAPLLAE